MATPASLKTDAPRLGRPPKPQPTVAQVDAQAAKGKLVYDVPADKAGAKVIVACKLPNGVVLKLHRPVEVDIPVMTGGVRVVREFHPDPATAPITVHGWRSAPDGITVIKGPAGTGTALTPNVPKGFWDRWFEENKASLLVTNHLVFAFESKDHAEGRAKELR